MHFIVEDYEVTIQEGKSNAKIDVVFNHLGSKTVCVDAPEELLHPMYLSFFKFRIKCMIDNFNKKQSINATSRYISKRERKTLWSVRKFKFDFSVIHGNIEVAKTNWDYNKAPPHSNKGKFGDLKAFCGMRKGQELELVAQGKS